MSIRRRSGFTLWEMMVFIAICAIGFCIIISSLSRSAHERSPRTVCINNQRQLGLALQAFVNQRGSYPNAGTFGESSAVIDGGDPAQSEINLRVFAQGGATFGQTAPGDAKDGADRGALYSWVVEISPHLDYQNLYNDFNRNRSYLDRANRAGDDPTRPSNWIIGSINIASLICPVDDTANSGAGNLSYVVNGGFSRWHAEGFCYGWNGAAASLSSASQAPSLDWGQSVATKTGVMFLGTRSGDAPWDYKTTPASITDGSSTTVLLTENRLAGASAGNLLTGHVPTNWACPHPNFVMFFGSDDVCTKGRYAATNCRRVGDLGSSDPMNDGAGWKRANQAGSSENINHGIKQITDGGVPFPSSNHAGGVVVAMCDGSTRFVKQEIDGTVWAKMLTPQGNSLTSEYQQRAFFTGALPQPE